MLWRDNGLHYFFPTDKKISFGYTSNYVVAWMHLGTYMKLHSLIFKTKRIIAICWLYFLCLSQKKTSLHDKVLYLTEFLIYNLCFTVVLIKAFVPPYGSIRKAKLKYPQFRYNIFYDDPRKVCKILRLFSAWKVISLINHSTKFK